MVGIASAWFRALERHIQSPQHLSTPRQRVTTLGIDQKARLQPVTDLRHKLT
jgi:hypothetical protein